MAEQVQVDLSAVLEKVREQRDQANTEVAFLRAAIDMQAKSIATLEARVKELETKPAPEVLPPSDEQPV